MRAVIPPSDIAAPGAAIVTVSIPGPNGATSNVVQFIINLPAGVTPVLATLNPATAAAGGPAFTKTKLTPNFIAEPIDDR